MSRSTSSHSQLPAKLLAAVAGIALSTAAVQAAPPFWGASYAYVPGPYDVTGNSSGKPVHVSALLPGNLACMGLAGARLDDPGPYPRVRDFLRAARVVVTLQPSDCPPPGKDQWLRFTVTHPYEADILDLVYVTTGGKVVGSEKVAISGGDGPISSN